MTPTTLPLQPRVIAVMPEAIELAGDGNSALFLAQVLFWWKASGRQKFYKFNAPCTHALYRTGDSWLEELRLKRSMFSTARGRVATKVRISCPVEIQAAFDQGTLVVYGTDETHLTWYLVNEAALAAKCPQLYHRLLGSTYIANTPPLSPASHSKRSAPTPQPSREKVNPDIPRCNTPALPNVEYQHSPMQEVDIGLNTESTAKIASELTTKTSLILSPDTLKPLPTQSASAGEGGASQKMQEAEVNLIAANLQQRGVQSDPARFIARRAHSGNWKLAQTLETFDAHLLDAKRSGARSPVGVAVSRMLDGAQITPAPRWALITVQHRNAEQEWDEGDGLGRNGVEVRNDLTNAIPESGQEGKVSPLKTLWEQALSDIKLQVTSATFEQRFRHTWLDAADTGYVVCCHDPHTVEWLEHRLHRLVTTSLQRHSGHEIAVRFAARPS